MNLLPSLFAPIKIKSVDLVNRVVMPPMGTNLGNPDGMVSEAYLAYIKRRAKGGAGLIITEITSVHPSGSSILNELGAYDDRFIPGLKKIADAVHVAGSKIALQLHHAGRESLYLLREKKAIAPSAIRSMVYGLTPREMTLEEIQEIITAFGAAAARAVEAGFDAVEVHGAHGYLLTQFLSTLSNKRDDKYGGSLSNRSRFMIEVLQEVRKTVGYDFPISLRLSVEECINDGYTFDDIQPILPELVKAGADILHASLGTHGSPGGITKCFEYQPGFNVWRAKKLKEVVGLPVIAVGRFTEPFLANEVIARGDADLVAFGRQFLADPDFLIKTRERRPEDIRKCLGCNQGCIERLLLEEGKIRCSINPETGQEIIYPQGPPGVSRRVWVVGSGPGGLTSAYEAARLGHNVTLCEKEEETGGQLRFASQAPFKDQYGVWSSWLTFQIKKMGVMIRKGTEVTESLISEGNPEVVILATGGEQIKPDIPGIELPLVSYARQVLEGAVPPGKHAVVIGGGLIGMETAHYLSQKGTQVTLVEVLKQSPVLKSTSQGYMLHTRLRETGCRLLFNTNLKKIEKSSVTILINDREEILSPVDQVIIAVGLKPNDELKKILQSKKIRYFVIGDALQPRRIIEATEEGARAAWNC